ncbi:MAG: hypothetical protein J7556_11400 [Acidovorax sp.]|nr:hypothetical protein [Acidovorax sp.]
MSFTLHNISKELNQRMKPALHAAGLHLTISIGIALSIGFLISQYWFKPPWLEIMSGVELFTIIVGVDVVCGPLLTLLIFNPKKSTTEKYTDFLLIGLIQLAALAYGLHTLSYARPIAIVHETDRLRVLSYAELEQSEADDAPSWAKPWGSINPRFIGIRPATSIEEKLKRIDDALQGIEPSQRPSLWQDYSLSTSAIISRSLPLELLYKIHPSASKEITSAVQKITSQARSEEVDQQSLSAQSIRWLPVVSQRQNNWVALINPKSGKPMQYLHLDGFQNP